MQNLLKTMETTHMANDIAAALRETSRLFEEKKLLYNDRQIMIFSDFQRNAWNQQVCAQMDRFMESFPENQRPRLLLFSPNRPLQHNVSCVDLRLSQVIALVDVPLRLYARLHNWGDTVEASRAVFLYVDGELRAQTRVDLNPGEEKQILFPLRFDTAGSHVVSILLDNDDLSADNRRSLSVPVMQQLPVLLLTPKQITPPWIGASLLRYGLAPYRYAHREQRDFIRLRERTPPQLSEEDLDWSRVIVLYGVKRLDDSIWHKIAQRVARGCGLLIFANEDMDVAWWDRISRGGSGIPAWRWFDYEKTGPQGIKVREGPFMHEALDIFNDPHNGTFVQCRIFRRYRLALGAGVKTVMAFEDNTPMVVEAGYGQGRVMGIPFDLERNVTNLPLLPVYLPWLHQLIAYLGSTVYPPRNRQVGETLVALLPLQDVGKEVRLLCPDGREEHLQVKKGDGFGVVTFNRTTIAGVYILEKIDGEKIHYAVNFPATESSLDFIHGDELRKLAARWHGEPFHSVEEYRVMERNRRYGQEVWTFFLWLAVLGLFGELVLIQYYHHQQNGGSRP